MWTKTIAWCGKVETVECKEHSYACSGRMPCTGVRRCIYCGKPAEKSMEGNVTSTNNELPGSQGSPKCLCKENGLHYKNTDASGKIISASLSLIINKDCPIHGYYMQS
jgi:hypothetical protein